MWLLSTDRAELHFYTDTWMIEGGYAALSHTWGGGELSFQDLRMIINQCSAAGTNPRDYVSDKVRNACILAESEGYLWVWVDTCCIDKTSSAELSEAINTMYRWYEESEICYAYLHDVPSDCVLDAADSAFRKSRWHTRGWTLQELLAPANVVFFAQDWSRLGTKVELAGLLEDITGVYTDILTLRQPVSSPSVGVRMWWASRRSTTRVEDEAYCLMGIFGVNIPTIYGEGRQAFIRLQHEIMKYSEDTTLFAWSYILSYESDGRDKASSTPSLSESKAYLLAPSPRAFTLPTHYVPFLHRPSQPYPPKASQHHSKLHSQPGEPCHVNAMESEVGLLNHPDLPEFALTNIGIRCRFPVIETNGMTIAILLVSFKSRKWGTRYLGLLLHRSNSIIATAIHKARSTFYWAGDSFNRVSNPNDLAVMRLIDLGDDLYNPRIIEHIVLSPRWRTIYVAGSLQHNPPVPARDYRRYNVLPSSPFSVPMSTWGRIKAMGFRVVVVEPSDGSTAATQRNGGVSNLMRIRLLDVQSEEHLHIDLCLCHLGSDSSQRALHCATVTFFHSGNGFRNWDSSLENSVHDCKTDHVAEWSQRTRVFEDEHGRAARISFTLLRGPAISNESTLAEMLSLRVELLGDVYQAKYGILHVQSHQVFRETSQSHLQAQNDPTTLPETPSQAGDELTMDTVHAALLSVSVEPQRSIHMS
ncbi:heterokaryon incompatibility protein-domain-containing protein [Daedaleopsis nitida]|nr:heterokaryon incompatibility protein-domain-containing protein [Daedaleopsis nitida]